MPESFASAQPLDLPLNPLLDVVPSLDGSEIPEELTATDVPTPRSPLDNEIELAIPEPTAQALRDQEALAEIKAGNTAAFEELFNGYWRLIRGYAASRLGISEAEDIAGQTFLRAFDSLQRNKNIEFGPRGAGPWLVIIAGNLVRDRVKSNVYKREQTTEELKGDPYLGIPSRTPEVIVEETLAAQALRDVIARLRPRYREVLTIRFLQDYSLDETAKVLGMTVNGVKALQHRAKAELREKLAGQSVVEDQDFAESA